MPVDPATNASSAVLAYNGDSPRGWNDPPTFTYKAGNSRPKLDLRKRVSHQQALQGGNTPPQPSTPTNLATFSPGQMANDMAGLILQPGAGVPPSPQPSYVPPGISHTMTSMPTAAPIASSPPSLSHQPAMNGVPSTYTGPSSMIPPVVPTCTPNTILSSSTPSSSDASTHLGQPLFSLKSHAFEPVKPHGHSDIRSTAEISDTLEHHDHGYVSENQPKMFHPISHVATNGAANTPILHPSPMVGHSVPSQAVLPYHPLLMPNLVSSPNTTGSHGIPPVTCAPPVQTVGQSSPTPPMGTFVPHPPSTPPTSVQGQLPPDHVTPPPPSATPPISHRTPPPPATLTPPTSASVGSTPRCLSPQGSDTDDSGMSDEQGLKATMDALDDVIQKYSSQMEKRHADDINRRLKIMSQMWMSGRLSKIVKSRMIKLAQALDDGKGDEAHHIHVAIMVDHVAEVNQWMVAVKRLISLVRHDPIRPTSS